jgi:hypothetical protein
MLRPIAARLAQTFRESLVNKGASPRILAAKSGNKRRSVPGPERSPLLATPRKASQPRPEEQLLARKRTEHEWLHRKRADAILEIYDRILDAEDAFEYLTRMLSYSGEPGPDERYKQAVDAGEAYRKFYRRHKPSFPSRIGELLDRVNRMFVEIANKYRIQRSLTENEYVALAEMMRKGLPQLSETLAVVEEVFRRMFGVTNGPPQKRNAIKHESLQVDAEVCASRSKKLDRQY